MLIVIIALVMLLVVYLYNRYSYKKRESRFPRRGSLSGSMAFQCIIWMKVKGGRLFSCMGVSFAVMTLVR